MQELELKGKVCVVTGASRGIGRAIAAAFAAEGCRVAICSRDSTAADKAAKEMDGDVIATGCDVGRYEDVEALFSFVEERLGGCDILINNAGVGHFASLLDLSIEQWREVIDTNLTGAFYCTKLAAAQMRQRGGGFIVNIGSLAGKNPFAGGAAYNASKFGLNGFSEAVMQDLRHDGIRVTQIMPGSVETDFTAGGSSNASWKLDPEQIAATCVHLVKMPTRNLASRVEMRPSQPPKK